MSVALEAAEFNAKKLDIRTDWTPKILVNNGPFSNEIKVHAPRAQQVAWTGMQFEIVQLDENNEYQHVDLNSTVLFTLTSELFE